MVSNQILRALLLVGPVARIVQANSFRGASPDVSLERVTTGDIRATMLDWANGGGGEHKMTEEQLQRVEDAMRPSFVALPKNAFGRLDHVAVRYALHRFFVVAHGMYVKGLEPSGQSWNNTASPAGILEDKVPQYVHGLFETLLGEKGFALHELSVLAATLEHLVHMESVARLKSAYASQGLSTNANDTATEAQVEEALLTYMQVFLLGKEHTVLTSDEVAEQRAHLAAAYPRWKETTQFLVDERRRLLAARPGHGADLSGGAAVTFDDAARVVEAVGEKYGQWQNAECIDLKRHLTKMEGTIAGRVPLRDFYHGAIDDAEYQFSESVPYLRSLGALDEDADPGHPHVIIPNYINAPSNCLASSGFYSICCINECEGLLGHLERRIAASEATPQEIAEVVATLPSSTVDAPRVVSEQLRSRLEDVAAHHGGKVPLHGRLFAQWMHNAYPRECSYPHLSGTTAPQTASEWMEATGQSSKATDEEIREHTQGATVTSVAPAGVSPPKAAEASEALASPDGAASQTPPETAPNLETAEVEKDFPAWAPEEELYVFRPENVAPRQAPRHPMWNGGLILALLAALVAFGRSAKAAFDTALQTAKCFHDPKHV